MPTRHDAAPSATGRARRRRAVHLLGLLLVALLASACQLRLATDVDVHRDGSGHLELRVAVDQELRAQLTDAGFDPTLGLDDAAAAAPDWTVETTEEDGGLTVSFGADFATPDDLSRLVADLQSSLGDEDAALLRDVSLQVDDDGSARFRARAGLLLPTSPGVQGDGITFDGEDLRALLATDGQRLVRDDLRLTLPGDASSATADETRGRTLVWHLPIGEQASISATGAPPSAWPWLPAAATFAGALLLGVLVVWLLRRRRARRRFRVVSSSAAWRNR